MTDQAGVDEPQTAMLLTQREWDDLASMLETWIVRGPKRTTPNGLRCVGLAERIIEANQ